MTNYISRVHAAGPFVVAWMLAVGLAAQPPVEQKPAPNVKGVSTRPILSIAGQDNFDAYCAVCHGKEGKGDGPAAPAMKAAVPDLTTMAKLNNGKFDAARVEYVVRGTGRTPTPAHGVEHMPIWGDVFRSEDPARARLRIGNLVKYIESIQAGSASPQ
jgi:mono/diheme cytochrome c family protein